MATAKSILFVDAYDSFARNITALLNEELHVNIAEIKIDTNVQQQFGTPLIDFLTGFCAVVLGPGPGDPNKSEDVGLLYDLLDAAELIRMPVLGICLGFQVLSVKYGLRVQRMKEPCHGQPKLISRFLNDSLTDNDGDIFSGFGRDEMQATCYNSLGVTLRDALSSPGTSRPVSSETNASFSTTSSQNFKCGNAALHILAIDGENNVMALCHRQLPFWGVQFHPESCKSNHTCRRLIRNWWVIVETYQRQTSIASKTNVSLGRCIRTDDNCVKPSSRSFNTFPVVPVSKVANDVASHLLNISGTSGNVVQWKSLKVNGGPEQVASIIHGLCDTSNIVMLESTKKGRFSIYAVTDKAYCQSKNNSLRQSSVSWNICYSKSKLSVTDCDSTTSFCTVATQQDIWNSLDMFLAQRRAINGSADIPFWGGLLGYLSYEQGLDTLEIQSQGSANRLVPEMSLLWVERSVVYDNVTNTAFVQSVRKNDCTFVEDMITLLSTSSTQWLRSQAQFRHHHQNLQHVLSTAQFSLPDEEQYKLQFQQCQSELRAGNSYELCLTTGATITIPKPLSNAKYEYDLYRNLHHHNPVPFGAYLKLGNVTILGTSPEQYMSWSRTGVIDMIPMKGTVKRSADMTLERASAILSSPKESAENLMIADLIRHDLYNAVGHTSKVEVVKLCEVVEHETVYQLVSHIRAHAPIDQGLKEDEKQAQAIHYGLKTLQTTLPPGSMTGAPKKRSCEILSTLEQRNRGVYSGVVGYMDVGGGGNWSVCIRTAFRSDDESPSEDVWHLGAGGAITVLSDAEGEWQEMMVKLNSVLQGFKVVAVA